MHPGGVDVVQKRQRLVDQVVVVEQSAALFLLRVAAQHRIDDGEQRAAAIAADHGVAAFENCADALLLAGEQFDQARIFDRFGDDGFARLAVVGAEDFQIRLDAIGAGQADERREAIRPIAVGFAALRQRRGNRGPFGRGYQRSGEKLGLDAVERVFGRDAQRARQLRDRFVDAAGARCANQ